MAFTGGRIFSSVFKKKSASKPSWRKKLKPPDVWSWQRLIVFSCFMFILGVAVGMYFCRIPSVRLTDAWQTAAAITVVMAGVVLLKRRSAWSAGALAVACVIVGIVHYSNALDTSDPHHLVHFAKEGFDERVTLTGAIVADPDVRQAYTHCYVRPDTIELDGGESFQPAGGGLVMVRLYPDELESYGDYAYGDMVRVRGALTSPRKLTNPGGFDYRRWLVERNGVYAIMYARRNSEIAKLGRARINPVVDFALKMKERTIACIRETMPYPESSFLGGVTLGLKGGVTQETRLQFQATGIAHVLAVSGLHVGFVAVLLVMIAGLMRLPDNYQPVFVTIGLILFTIITGASPATVRASIMFSLFVCINTYMVGMGIYSSSLLTIPLAAAAILIANPLLLMDASFLLSFGAVLSLALLTWPVQNLFNHVFQGFRFWAGVIIVLILTVITHAGWNLFFEVHTAAPIFAGLGAILAVSHALELKFPGRVRYGFSSMNKWVAAFIAAQFAIQLGNSPLFALYFFRLSISGWYANFIAIPLCGVIVQLGLLAGLLYMIPVVGPTLAALVNGGNYFLCKFFLGSATFFYDNFPYPYVGTPTVKFSVIYYGALFLFVYYRFFWNRMATVATWWRMRDQFPEVRGKLYATIVAAGFAFAAIPGYFWYGAGTDSELKMAFLDVGQASATLIVTPSGRGVLVDGGSYDRFRNFDAGQSVIAPAMAEYGMAKIDAAVLTTFANDHLGGMAYLLNQFYTRRFVDCLPPNLASDTSDWPAFSQALAATPYAGLLESNYADETFDSYRTVLQVLKQKKISRVHFDTPTVLIEEKAPGGMFRITVLAVPETGYATVGRTSLIKVEYGKTSVLLTGHIDEDDLTMLARKVDTALLKSTVLLMPSHGASLDDAFISAVSPEYAVIQTRPQSRNRGPGMSRKAERAVETLDEHNVRAFVTERDGAVLMSSNGSGLTIKPFGE